MSHSFQSLQRSSVAVCKVFAGIVALALIRSSLIPASFVLSPQAGGGDIAMIVRADTPVDVERYDLAYKPNPYFSARVGRFHVFIGYYNTASCRKIA
jgi:hypothetical protein